jgi:hypothetical protein
MQSPRNDFAVRALGAGQNNPRSGATAGADRDR